MRVALDTNVLAYAEGIGSTAKQFAARAVIEALPREAVVIPAQALGELYVVLTRKARRGRAAAARSVLAWSDAYPPAETSRSVIIAATDLASRHQLQFWDAVMLSAAASAQCRMLLSEDMQHGFLWNGVTVVDPFRRPEEPIFSALLGP